MGGHCWRERWPDVVPVAGLGSPELERRLRGRSVLVRPDRIVAAVSPR